MNKVLVFVLGIVLAIILGFTASLFIGPMHYNENFLNEYISNLFNKDDTKQVETSVTDNNNGDFMLLSTPISGVESTSATINSNSTDAVVTPETAHQYVIDNMVGGSKLTPYTPLGYVRREVNTPRGVAYPVHFINPIDIYYVTPTGVIHNSEMKQVYS